MLGHLILLIGKNTNGQKRHLQSASLAEIPSKNLGDTLAIYSYGCAFWIVTPPPPQLRLLSLSAPSSPLSCFPCAGRCWNV